MINRELWNTFPTDIQKGIRDAIDWRTKAIIEFDYGEIQRGIDYAISKGDNIITLTDDQIKVWQDFVAPVIQNWIDGLQAKGLPAQKAYETFKQLVKSYPGK